MKIKNRNVLYRYFAEGNLPTADHFAALIDSMVHQDELKDRLSEQAGVLKRQIEGNADGENTEALQLPFKDVWTFMVEADGKPHEILSKVEGINAVFDISAEAIGEDGTANYAVVHAVAAISQAAQPQSIKQTSAYSGWRRRRRISIRWEKDIDEPNPFKRIFLQIFHRNVPYKLCIKTHHNYGSGCKIKGVVTQKIGSSIPQENRESVINPLMLPPGEQKSIAVLLPAAGSGALNANSEVTAGTPAGEAPPEVKHGVAS